MPSRRGKPLRRRPHAACSSGHPSNVLRLGCRCRRCRPHAGGRAPLTCRSSAQPHHLRAVNACMMLSQMPARPPANETIVASGARAIDGWKVAPGSARSQYPEDTIEDAPIIDAGYAARLGREHRTNDAPLVVGELIRMTAASQLEAAAFHASTSGSWAEADIASRVVALRVL